MKGLGSWVATKGTEGQRDKLTNSNERGNAFVTKKERQETLRSMAISRSPIKKRNQ
jgi:hypothetical protein